MKKHVLLIAFVLFLAGNTIAQRSGFNGEKQSTRLKTELSLTDDQVTRIRDMNKELGQAYSRLRSDTTLTREVRMQRRKALAETRQNTMREILSKEQYGKWLAMKPAEMHRPSRQMGQTSAERFKKHLGLSDEQADKIASIHAAMARRFQDLRSDTTLTRDDRRQAWRQIVNERDSNMKKVLTPAQYEKLTALRNERMTGVKRRSEIKR